MRLDLQDRRVRALAGYLTNGQEQAAEILVGRDVEATMRTSDRVKKRDYNVIRLCFDLGAHIQLVCLPSVHQSD